MKFLLKRSLAPYRTILDSVGGNSKISQSQLESHTNGDFEHAVRLRREYFKEYLGVKGITSSLPYKNFDYSKIYRKNCESVIGYVPIPVGIVGPLMVNNKPYFVPLATTEGALVASVSRGCKALNLSLDGVQTTVLKTPAMTRAPVVQFLTPSEAIEFAKWASKPRNVAAMAVAFNRTSRYARLLSVDTLVFGRCCHIRISAFTADAMGMNMLSRGANAVISFIKFGLINDGTSVPLPDSAFLYCNDNAESAATAVRPCKESQFNISKFGGFEDPPFPNMELLALSGNLCTDKKTSSSNWTKGRGHSVIANAKIPGNVVCDVFRTTSKKIEEVAYEKLYIGTALSGGGGGSNNAQCSNIVAALFAATGQDLGQVISSSAALVSFRCVGGTEKNEDDLLVSVYMPVIEIATVGGGTGIPAQKACLDIIGVAGGSPVDGPPGIHTSTLAQVLIATVLAGELNLHAALASNVLLQAHMNLNR